VTPEVVQAQWAERMKTYKARKFDNPNQQAIENYLVQGLVAWGDGQGIGAYHKLILKQGEWMIGRKLAKDYPVCASYQKRRRPKVKQCFYNSQIFVALENADGAKYYEGFMCDGMIAVMHGWVVMPDGNVVDFTLEARDKLLKNESDKDAIVYLGVEIPVDFIRKKIVELKYCTALAHMCYMKESRPFTF
jgi:hypothetical protein